MAEVELLKVCKTYGDGHRAVADVDLRIRDKEIMILVGPSGCGKSTILRVIAGLEEASSGEVRIDGQLVNDLPPRDRDVAMVFQSYALYPHMTVRDNLAYPLRIARADSDDIRSRVRDAADILDLHEHLDRKPAQLSGGQRQRVAMGRAIVRDPKAFLMDEPLSNLDAKLRVQTRTQIALLQQRLGATMVYVTHDQTEAMTLGDRVAVMCDGMLQQVGTPLELYDEPANLFVAGFIGAPAMNMIPGVLENGRVVLPVGSVTAPDLPARESRDVVAAFRPEVVQLTPPPGDPESSVSVRTAIEVLEATGSELYAHLPVVDPQPDRDGSEQRSHRVVVRLDAKAPVREGGQLEIWVDASQIHIFDRESGRRLGFAGGESRSAGATPDLALSP